MSSGGKKADEIKATEGEKIQAGLAKDQIAYYRGTYAPLEQRALSEANQDPSARFSGQVGSAGLRASTETLQNAALNGGVTDTAALGGAIAGGRTEANAAGRRERDDSRLDVLKMGLGLTADAHKSLSAAGQMQTGAAIDRAEQELVKIQSKQDVKNAKVAAVGTVAGAAGSYYGLKAMGDKQALADRRKLTTAQANATANTMNNRISMGTAFRGAQGFN